MGVEDIRIGEVAGQHESDDRQPIVLEFGVGTIYSEKTFRTETHALSPDLELAAEQANEIILGIDSVSSHLTTDNERVQLPDGSVITLDELRIRAGIQERN